MKSTHKSDRVNHLGTEPINKLLVKLGVPSVISTIITAIYNIVDMAYLGRLHTSAVAAVAIVIPIYFIAGAIGQGIGLGAASLISRKLGEKDLVTVNQTASTSIFLGTIIGVLFGIFGILFLKPLLLLFGATETIMLYAVDYARILIIAAFVTINVTIVDSCIRAEGNTMLVMIGMLVGTVVNIILDPIFIFTCKMGAAGAAFATVLSQFINLIIVGEYFYSKKSVAHISLCFVTLQKKLLSEITKIGFPAFIRNTCSSITVILVNVLLKPYGDYAIATIAIVMRVQMFGIFLAVGLAQGFQPIAGYNFGARKFERLFEAIKKASLIALLMTFSVALLNWIAPQWVLRIFTDDIKIIEMGTYALRVSFVIFPFLGVQIVFTNLFQAIGKAVPAMLLALSRQLLFYVPALLILSKIAKYPGIIWSQPVADFLTMILAIAFMIGITRFLQNESITESNQ